MKKDATEKKTRQGLSLSPELLAAAKAKGGGNLSAYIRGLIERDLSGQGSAPDALSPTILEDLCARLRGEKLERLRAALRTPYYSCSYSFRDSEQERAAIKERAAPVNQQPRILAELIESLIDYAEDKGSFFSGKFTLVSASRLPLARLIDSALESAETDQLWLDDASPELKAAVELEYKILNAAASAIDKLLPAPARRRKHDVPTTEQVNPSESISAVSKKLKENSVRPTQPIPAKQ